MPGLVPPLGRLEKGFVVRIPSFLDHLLETHIATHSVPGPVEEQQGEQSRHPAIAIEKRVDAQEVHDVRPDQEQRVRLARFPFGIQALVQRRHGGGGQMRKDGLEADTDRSIR